MRHAAVVSAMAEIKGSSAFCADLLIIHDALNDDHAREVAMVRCEETFPPAYGWEKHNVIVLLIPDVQPAAPTKAPKPTPKELIIWANGVDSVLHLVASSNEALMWIKTEAGQFGYLTPYANETNKYTLVISKAYDPKQVLAYLNSYNDPA